MEEESLQRLRQFVAKLSAGRVPVEMQPELAQLLDNCWHMFSGGTEERMEAYKLKRMEDPWWKPPLLTFTIERHGGTSLGSTRAGLQEWDVYFDRLVSECQIIGYRQLDPRQAPLDVKPIADELVKLILSGSRDERLQWSAVGRLRIRTGRILSSGSIPQRILEGHRKRFNKALEERLAPYGWQRQGSWWERKKLNEKSLP